MNPIAAPQAALTQQQSLQSVQNLSLRAASQDQESLREVCQEFESLFVKMMLDSMRDTLADEGGLIPKNSGEKLFEDELYGEYAKSMSRTANLGIADMMYNQLSTPAYTAHVDITG